ncbi:MAG: hypothetical protein O7F71_19505 [Gammaproteobacteria bacterium]|nr:hypothetical protein [Gammaproteobacteria bacterium]
MKSRILCLCTCVSVLLAAPPAAIADDEEVIPYDEAEVFFELNNTDGDLGIHALIDGDAWKRLRIKDADEKRILDIKVRGRLRRQGLTEIFFESAEPTFDELTPESFFSRFPEGTYEISGKTLEGEKLASETEVTHVMPAPPDPTVNGNAVEVICDDEDPDYDPAEVSGPVVIAWDPVTSSHPTLVSPPNVVAVSIVNYEVVVESELKIDGEEFVSILSVILPPDVTEMTIPAEFLAGNDTFKYEVLAREESWNQTAIESCFVLEGDD